jgi:hypothetical protein
VHNAGVLDELIERFGPDAVVTAYPLVLENGETYRWELEINGIAVAGVNAQARRVVNRPNDRMLFMVSREEEIELGHWSTKSSPHDPARFVETLGRLARNSHRHAQG